MESINRKLVKAKNGRMMLLSNCAFCANKKLRFIKEQEASALMNSLLGHRTPLSGIPIMVAIFG